MLWCLLRPLKVPSAFSGWGWEAVERAVVSRSKLLFMSSYGCLYWLAPMQVAEERAAVLAEERANVERLLVLISSSINQDLPARLQVGNH